MNKGHHTAVNGVFFRLEKESKSIHSSLKKSWQTIFGIKRGRPRRPPKWMSARLPLLDGGWCEALRQQCFAEPYLSLKFLNEPLEPRGPGPCGRRSSRGSRYSRDMLCEPDALTRFHGRSGCSYVPQGPGRSAS